MISRDIFKNGQRNLIFHSGNTNTFENKQELNFYKSDFDSLTPKFFQQDETRSHLSKGPQIEIKKLIEDNFLPTWEFGPKFN